VIAYYLHIDIDTFKWNRCIEEAGNGLIYANSFYLDMLAGSWDALVLNDYEAVMPLTWNRKYGLYYLYQPYFIPSLGIFGLKDQKVTTLDFLTAIPRKFRYWDIKLNESNSLTGNISNQKIPNTTGTNYLLNLNKPYKEICADYSRLCLRMVKKAADNQVEIVRDGKPVDVIAFYRKLYTNKHKHISPGTYSNLIACTTKCFEMKQAKIYLAKLPDGEVIAAYLVLVDKKFVYSLIGGSSEKGKQTGSFYFVTDAAIKDHAGSERVFRFEGSDIHGIAFFNTQFAPELINYYHLIRNKLPFPLNLFKKYQQSAISQTFAGILS
jgi:hypothetical protein